MDCELSAGLKCGIIDCGMVEKSEGNLGCVAGRNWSGTLQRPNAEPVGMTANNEVWSIALRERPMPPALGLWAHDKSDANTRLGSAFIHGKRVASPNARKLGRTGLADTSSVSTDAV